MVGRQTRASAKRLALPIAALALLGAGGVGQAQDRVDLSAESVVVEVPLEEAFAPFDTPIEPALPDHAVDITTIEPASPATVSLGSGTASYYGRRFHGRLTANGERFDMNAMTAAHRTLPFGTRVRVTNPRNGQSVVVRINDRGPFVRGRTIDLSRAAAQEIGMIRRGHAQVELAIIED